MTRRYESIEYTLKRLKVNKKEEKEILRIFGELVLDKEYKIILEELNKDKNARHKKNKKNL